MSESATAVLGRYLEDAIAAEKGFESQLRSYAGEGDDQEVQSFFATHAGETAANIVGLTKRLEELGGSPSPTKSFLAHILSLSPRAAQITQSPEERLVQNLIAAFSVEMSECALYESLGVCARAAGDGATADLAHSIALQSRETAARLFHFLPSRSKIAFNILTAGEIDPSVETKAPDDRLI